MKKHIKSLLFIGLVAGFGKIMESFDIPTGVPNPITFNPTPIGNPIVNPVYKPGNIYIINLDNESRSITYFFNKDDNPGIPKTISLQPQQKISIKIPNQSSKSKYTFGISHINGKKPKGQQNNQLIVKSNAYKASIHNGYYGIKEIQLNKKSK